MRAFTVLTVASLLVVSSTLSAQRPPPIEPGARVRVTAPECGLDQQAGTLQPSRGDTLVLGYGFDSFPCLRSNVTRLEVSQGRRSATLQGLGYGALVGAGVGAAIAVALCYPDRCSGVPTGELVGGMSVLGLGGGLVIGAVIGSRIQSDRWEETPLDRLRVSFAPQRDMVSFGLRIAF